jgi:hypothetical protein
MRHSSLGITVRTRHQNYARQSNPTMVNGLTLTALVLQSRGDEVRDNSDIDTAIHLQVHLPVTRPRAQFNRIPGPLAPAAHPSSKSPDGIRRLKQRDKRRRVRANRHERVKSSTTENRNRERQPPALQLTYSINRNRRDRDLSFRHA